MQMQNKKFYNFVNNADNSADVYIYGTITSWRWDDEDVSADSFKEELEALGDIDTLNVHINSYGGEVFQGFAIYNLLRQHKAKVNVYIDGIAASIASVIAMAGDRIYIPKTAILMIHNCSTHAWGNSKDLRKTAEDMDKTMEALRASYMSRVNISEDKLQELLDDESYLTADEAVEMGFADEIIEYENENPEMVASTNIYNLVMKLKEKDKKLKDKEDNKNIDLQNVQKTINTAVKSAFEDLKAEIVNGKLMEKPEVLLNNQDKLNQDTLAVSFLNNFLKK